MIALLGTRYQIHGRIVDEHGPMTDWEVSGTFDQESEAREKLSVFRAGPEQRYSYRLVKIEHTEI